MSAYTISTISKNSVGHNEDLRLEMISVLKHAYVYPEKVIDKRFYALDKIFLLRKEEKLHGFCTYFTIDLELKDKIVPSIFLGIMASSQQIQNTGLVLKTMTAMVADISNNNPFPQQPQLIWATTASPSSLAIFRRYFNKVSPDVHNEIHSEHRDLDKAMKKILLQGKADPGYPPLVVKETSAMSIYSPMENERIKALQKNHPENIFRKLGIDETRGDRLIMIGEI